LKRLLTIIAFTASTLTFAQNFNWTAQTSGVTSHLNDVFFVDNQTGWVVGAGGVILHTTDGGTTWTPQSSGTTNAMRAVFFLDANTGWALGKDIFNVLLKTTDGGATWSDITSSSISTGTLRDVVFTDTLNGWMVSSDSIYKSIDGGVSWIGQSVITSVSPTGFRALAVTLNGVNTIGTPYVGGSSKRSGVSGAYADVFAKSSTTAWDFVSGSGSFKTNDLGILSIAFATRFIGFAGGTQGTIYKIDIQGSTNSGPWDINLDLGSSTTQGIKGISFPTASNGMFLTAAPTSAINTLIYHTSDTGNTWNMMPDTIPGLIHEALHAPDANTAWVVGVNGAIYKGVLSGIGIEEGKFSVQTSVFPNPTSGLVTVELNGEVNGVIDYTLIDITGRQMVKGVWKKDGEKQRFELDMTDFVTGIYMLNIATSNGQNQVIRIAKK